MLQVVEINAVEHLEAIRLRWTAMLYETPGASFFHTLDWLKIYCRHFGGGQRLRVLLVYRGGSLLGILPLVVRNEATVAGPVEALTYPTIEASHLHGPIGPNPTATLMASFRHLADQSRDWDLLSLADIGEHDRGRTANALELAGFFPHEVVHHTVSKVCFDTSLPENLCEHESEIAGGVIFERIRPLGSTYGDGEPLEGLVDECFSLEQHAPLIEPSCETSAPFLRDVITTASGLGMLDLCRLKLDGRLIACSVNVHFDGAIQQLCVGRDARRHPFDASAVLTRRMLRDSFSRNDRCLCFADSNYGVSHIWATQQLPVVRYQYRARMPLGARLMRFGQWLRSS